MPSPLSNESRALLAMLLHGEWRPLDEVKAGLGGRIPPGRALRMYEVRENSRLNRAGKQNRYQPELPDDVKIASGRAALTSQTLWSLSKRHVEVAVIGDGEDRVRCVRIRPEVLDEVRSNPTRPVPLAPQLPGEAPAESLPDQGAGVEPQPDNPQSVREDRIRAIVTEVVTGLLDRHLDEFAYGLQSYLDRSFGGLERIMFQRWVVPAHDGQSRGQARRRR